MRTFTKWIRADLCTVFNRISNYSIHTMDCSQCAWIVLWNGPSQPHHAHMKSTTLLFSTIAYSFEKLWKFCFIFYSFCILGGSADFLPLFCRQFFSVCLSQENKNIKNVSDDRWMSSLYNLLSHVALSCNLLSVFPCIFLHCQHYCCCRQNSCLTFGVRYACTFNVCSCPHFYCVLGCW